MTKRVIIFNGPPGVGKDFAASMTKVWISRETKLVAATNKMADNLKRATHALFGLFHSPEYYDGEGSKLKNEKHPLLFGMSPRQAYIKVSEKMVKPVLGNDIFGRIAANTMHNATKVNVHIFSDGGFVDEWRPVIDWMQPENVLLIEIHSSKHTFGGDSRSYIGEQLKELYPELTVAHLKNYHSGDPFDKELFVMLVHSTVKKFLGE